jgi:hypothetical protein
VPPSPCPDPQDPVGAAPAEDAGRLTLLGRALPGWLTLRILCLAPGTEHAYDPAEWRGALVVVERGAITLIPWRGAPRALPPGAVLWLADLPLRAVANPHGEHAVLSVLSRTR